MTYGALKSALRLELFREGEAPQDVVLHDKSFLSAMIDIQSRVDCFKVNNTLISDFCSTLFECGMTVMNKPKGVINKVSVFARRDEDFVEDAESQVQWCDEVEYHYVDYTKLTRLLDKRLRCSSWPSLASMMYLDSFVCQKALGDAYPAPDDADFTDFPELPRGFHYPQASTDSAKGRARCGVYAFQRGRLYIAPWIQSTEVAVTEWDGVKTDWADGEEVGDDPMHHRSVRLYVAWEHARDCDNNVTNYEIYERDYKSAIADLIDACDKENRESVRRPSVAMAAQTNLTGAEVICDTDTGADTEGQQIFSGTVEPNGNQSATGPAIYLQYDTDGNFVAQWSKPDGSTGNTGWL